MARTNSTLVQGVLNADYGVGTNLTPYIDAASSIVDDVVECATRKGKSLSDSKLELIERWLSAHMYCMMDKPYASKSTSGASGSFHGQTAMGFQATLYGQMAMRIDSSGCLTNIDETQVATGFWMGKPKSQQTDYTERN